MAQSFGLKGGFINVLWALQLAGPGGGRGALRCAAGLAGVAFLATWSRVGAICSRMWVDEQVWKRRGKLCTEQVIARGAQA